MAKRTKRTNKRQQLLKDSSNNLTAITNSKEFPPNSLQPGISSNNFRSQIHCQYNSLRCQLKLTNKLRKYHIDSLLKKTKSRLFKLIHIILNKCLKIKVNRLSQDFITNIRIEYNKKFLGCSIRSIYERFCSNFFVLAETKNINEEKVDYINNFLRLSFKQLMIFYIKSKKFGRDCKEIKEKEGEGISALFYFMCINYIEYYNSSKGNKTKNDFNALELYHSLTSSSASGSQEGVYKDNTSTFSS